MESSNIKQNEPLSAYCTYRIGGPAQVLFFAANKDQIIAGLEVARENNIPFFILGGGSNVLFSDNGFAGLVLKIENNEIQMLESNGRAVLTVGAGAPLSTLTRYALDNGLSGMEWAAGIPGTVGGAIRGNAGAFHGEISENIVQVQALKMSPEGIAEKTFPKSECAFSYRESYFKHHPDFIIISATISLEFGQKDGIQKILDDYLNKKSTSQPLNHPSAGSVFTNPPNYFAGKIIEDCGFKGKTIGGAQVSEKHSNFIINLGNATAQNVKDLIWQIKDAAKQKLNIDLKEEIVIV